MANIAPMTLSDMRILLETALPSLLAEQETALEAAQQKYNDMTDPRRNSTEVGRQAALVEQQKPLDEARAKVRQAADVLQERIDAVRANLETPMPPQLSDGDMMLANHRATFAKEDMEKLSTQELEQRIRAAIVTDDKPMQFLYLRYYRQGLHKPAPGTDTRGVSDLITDIQGRLADKRLAPLTEKAKALRLRIAQLHGKSGPSRSADTMRREERYSSF